MSEKSLDRVAAEHAQKMVKAHDAKKDDAENLERVATKALGVLQENGVYACMLFLYSRPEKEQPYAQTIREQLIKLLDSEPIRPLGIAFRADNGSWRDVADHFVQVVTKDLDKLLLVKALYEQTLIYTRYGAKAARGG
jgi:hypothetical protein